MNKSTFLKVLFFLSVLNSIIFNLCGQITFERIYDFPSPFINAKSALPIDNGYILFGNKLARTNEHGDTIWTRNLVSNSNLYTHMVISSDSVIRLFGGTTTNFYGNIFLTEYNLLGDSLKSIKIYPYDTTVFSINTISTSLRGICKLSDGGFIISGYRDSSICCNYIFFVMKIDSLYNTVWVWNEDNEVSQLRVADVIETSDRSILVMYEESEGGFNIPLTGIVKLDSLGNLIWDKAECNYHSSNSLIETSGHEYVLSGYCCYGINCYSGTGYIEKIDTSGYILWRNTNYYNSPLCSTFNGGFAGISATHDSLNNFHLFLSLFDSAGQLLYSRFFRSDVSSAGSFITQASDSGFIIAGYAKDTSQSSGMNNYYLIKTDKYGDISSAIPNYSYEKVIKFYPNPVFDKLQINVTENSNCTINIYNSSGVLVYKTQNQGFDFTVDFSGNSSGFYFMRIVNEKSGTVSTFKIVKLEK